MASTLGLTRPGYVTWKRYRPGIQTGTSHGLNLTARLHTAGSRYWKITIWDSSSDQATVSSGLLADTKALAEDWLAANLSEVVCLNCTKPIGPSSTGDKWIHSNGKTSCLVNALGWEATREAV